MSRKTHIILLLLAGFLLAHVKARGQNISEIAQSDPLIITGTIGTQNTYRYASAGTEYGSPFSTMLYANMNVALYGISMPFAISYSNSNVEYNYPHLSLAFMPQYKDWTGYIGESTMAMSKYVMDMSFNGVGLEYEHNKFRTGAFYGILQKAINDDPSDPLARTPQMKRVGWGFKVGYGTKKNYIDLYLLRAYDVANSIDEKWRESLAAQENLVVGLKGCVTPFSWMSFTANAAMSVFNTDKEAPKIVTDETEDFDKIFTTRYSTLARFAGDASLNLSYGGVDASITYKFIQPDYKSLGTYYMSNNYHSLGVTMSTTLFNKVALSGTFSGQSDNLTKEQLYTTNGYVYGLNAASRIGDHFAVTAAYSGYLQNQSDGTMQVNDTTRVNRRMSSYTLTPQYALDGETLGHTVALSASYTENKDLNKFADGSSDVKSLALGASYDMEVKPWEVDFSVSLSHQLSKNTSARYTSDVCTFGASRSFLKEKNLKLSATTSICYNEMKGDSKSMSIGGNLSATYTIKKDHAFSLQAGINKYGDVNLSRTRSKLDDTDVNVTFSYAYTLPAFGIKRKAKAPADE